MLSPRLTASALMACLLATPALAQTTPMTAAPMAAAPMAATPGASSTMAPSASGATGMSAVSGAFRPITPMAAMNIVAELRASGQFTTLLKALDATNLTSVIQNQPNITLLAPTDAAFAALPPADLTALMEPANVAKLRDILTYHLINARVSLDKVANHAAGPVTTVSTKPVTIDGTGSVIKVNDANVLQAAVPASNGLIYVVDKVLMPTA